MNKKWPGAALGCAVLAISTAASAQVDVTVGLPVGVYAPAQPVYVAPALVKVGYDEDWRNRRWHDREWHEREWREREWRERERREREWRESHRR
jgi:hypothetical protein